MTPRKHIQRILKREPELTYEGFWLPFTFPRDQRDAQYQKSREQMLTPAAITEFKAAYRWLSAQPRTKNVNRDAGTSYGLKEFAEQEEGIYISNGIFIAAAFA